ncbi:MAG: VTT domain-containing protein [Legionellaceae bacterium]|nr:VTT domain-containing protein [Legionellaceae bacterium]
MHLFVDYIEPMTTWLHLNPKMALFFTFIISCTESLAIIGSIIPGSLTMTAIGIMAGSGVMRIDLTIIAASFGALVGDGVSYAIGYIYCDHLVQIWPFSKYPSLIRYGKDFFIKHGGKSVVIGRFIGPLRSIIPVIAGIMNMPKLLFFFTNLISAFGWALLYVMPGYLVGAASSQLSTDGARRLFGLIILSLLAIWILSKIVHIVVRAINSWYTNHIDTIYAWSINHPYLKLLFRSSPNKDKRINGFAISLLLAWVFCLVIALLISMFVIQNTWVNSINEPISFFFNGIRTSHIDNLFILINLITSPVPILCLFGFVLFSALFTSNWRMSRYLVSIAFSTTLIIYCIATNIDVPNSTYLYQLNLDATFPVISLTWSTSLISFLICYLIEFYRRELPLYLLRLGLISILVLSGVSSVYLGDNWTSSVIASYFIGLSIGIMHWILYQRQVIHKQKIALILLISIFILVVMSWMEYSIHSPTIIASHKPITKQYKLTEKQWWNQEQPILPIYTTNRMGKKIGIFNLQYLGNIKTLEKRLSKSGWIKKQSSVFYSLIIRLDGKHSEVKLPIMEQLFLNKRPELIMVYSEGTNSNMYILRLWKSNYYIANSDDPIWIGSIILASDKNDQIADDNKPTNTNDFPQTIFFPLQKTVKSYRFIPLNIPSIHSKRFKNVAEPKLLIFKNKKTR